MSSSVTQLCSRGDNFPCWCHCWFPARCLWNSAFSCPRRRRVCELNSSLAGPLVSWPRNHELVHAWQLFKLILRVNYYSAVDTVSVLPLLCLYNFFNYFLVAAAVLCFCQMCYGYVPLFACLFSVKLSNKKGHERSIDVPVLFYSEFC